MKCTTMVDPEAVAQEFSAHLVEWIDTRSADQDDPVTICLSGGSTPQRMFEILSDRYADRDWSRVAFFWGDERCVPPDDSESNFGVAQRLFLQPAKVPASSVHRVLGEWDPERACEHYAQLLTDNVPLNAQDWPQFDLMILGMGSDGHTASIFPDRLELITDERLCATAQHPETGQFRVTITGGVIRASRRTCFLITGAAKADVLGEIIHQSPGHQQYPTSQLCRHDNVEMFLDQAAAARL